ncbi:ABC transporter ATP-binding protein [Pantoea sp. A4]|uniref:ABC transporter ATP-binding protein n=1 Tax=Pantoea sp. A4 TaxID=1225184 RepID=UPI0003772A73|nr:ABC transporter ATP-binding protein [Pantoea sp. A4]
MKPAPVQVAVRDLNWSVGKQRILHNLSLTFPAGETVALLGPSGCGKSTLLKLLAGLTQPESGEIWFDDRCIASARFCTPPEGRQLGMVFQDYALWPHMSVAQNIAFPLRMRGVEKATLHSRVEEMLTRVGLEGFAQRKPSALSGGQQQRVALARALIAEPAILLFDEPLSNLDRDLRESLAHSMKQLLRQSGTTAVYVTHDREEANIIADRIVHLAQGQVHSITQNAGNPDALTQPF